ncbi:hypothetical protein [Phaffia rhodozyma]|uniref:Large ribosomal subunit protein bL21m n=1 Tax=Phaffia rhodozyma TaxID=264483 RepID=A0A0F7SWE5_PHARH|nr:hypothetical protein [Phaffia rhodozyma]
MFSLARRSLLRQSAAPLVVGTPARSFQNVNHGPSDYGLESSQPRSLVPPAPSHHIQPTTPHSAVTLLNSQPEKYIVAKVYAQKYLLHPTEILTVPRLETTPELGSVIKLTRVFEVGSRDFALKATEGNRLTGVECSLTVLEHTTGPMETVLKTKRRKGYKKEVRSKQRFTRLRVGDIKVLSEQMDPDEQPKERTLQRPVSKPFDQYSPFDQSIRGKLARQYGIVGE